MTVLQTIKDQMEYLLDGYIIDENRVIQSPGKFEGEMYYALYFNDCVMNGRGNDTIFDDNETPIDIFDITEVEKLAFKELKDAKQVWYMEDDAGFVYCTIR